MKKVFLLVLFLITPVVSYSLTFNDLSQQLANSKPIVVGFDVDDTVFFTSPAFYAANNKYCRDTVAYDVHFSSKSGCEDGKFWNEINVIGIPYSLPKAIGKKLIDFHQSRGDKILFITKRFHSEGEMLTKTLQDVFGIKNMTDVIFTNELSKSPYIKEFGVKIYYGDSDSDITDAKDAGSRPIRVLRTPISNARSSYNPGIYSEDVLDDSAV